MEDQARVVFSGACLPGHEPEIVASAYAKHFGITQGEALDVIEAAEPVTLERQVGWSVAEAMREHLSALGLEVDLQLLISDEWSPFWEDDEPQPSSSPELDSAPTDEGKPAYWKESLPSAKLASDEPAIPPTEDSNPGPSHEADFDDRTHTDQPTFTPTKTRKSGKLRRLWMAVRGRWVEIRIVAGAAVGLAVALFLTSMMLPKTGASDEIANMVKGLCAGKVRCEAVVGRQVEYCWQTTGMAERFSRWSNIDESVVKEFKRIDRSDFVGCFVDQRGAFLFANEGLAIR